LDAVRAPQLKAIVRWLREFRDGMMTRITFSAILIFGVFIGVAGQDRPSWVSQLEVLLRKEESKWTITGTDVQSAKGHFHEAIILKSGSLRADVIIDIWDSAMRAKEQFDGEKIAFTNILEKYAVKSTLEGLGDENFMFTAKGKRNAGNVFLIQDNILLKVFGPSAETAKTFTKHVVDLMPPPNKRLQPTLR
jgi:hypothetical protein